jgi:hypothetical protein
MTESQTVEKETDNEGEEKFDKLFASLWTVVSRALKAEMDPELLARSVLHFAFMANGRLADDYDLALKTAAEALAISSEKVREYLEASSKEEQEKHKDRIESAPEGVTLH